MKKLLILSIGLLFLSTDFQAQEGNLLASYMNYFRQMQTDKTTKFEEFDLEKIEYIGSPYVNKNFERGNIYLNSKLIVEEVPLRYNAFADEMEFKESLNDLDEDSKALTKSPEVDIEIGNTLYVFVPYQGGIEKGGYFEALVRGEKYDLFKKYNKKFSEGRKAQTSMTKDMPAKFTDNPVYYLVSDEGVFYELPTKKRAFSKVFLKKENEINDYIKDNKLDIKNEKDLIKIINYFNSIQ